MKFDVEIIIRTHPGVGSRPYRTEIVESATVTVESDSYNGALERTFEALKTCSTFKEFMDTVNMNEVKYPKEEK
jgi:hypothetical protein